MPNQIPKKCQIVKLSTSQRAKVTVTQQSAYRNKFLALYKFMKKILSTTQKP